MRIMRKRVRAFKNWGEIKEEKIKGAGIKRTISMSNTKKITAKRKKRVEKGRRALSFGSNPHSKGVLFSRSLKLRILKK